MTLSPTVKCLVGITESLLESGNTEISFVEFFFFTFKPNLYPSILSFSLP